MGAGDERVGVRRVVTLICAGWLPQDGLFGGSWTAGLAASVARRGCSYGRRGFAPHAAVTGSVLINGRARGRAAAVLAQRHLLRERGGGQRGARAAQRA